MWSRVKATGGWQPLRVVATNDGRIVGGVQILKGPLPLSRALAYAAMGPVIQPDEPETAELILDRLQAVAREYRIEYLAVQPPIDGTGLVPRLEQRGFRPSIGDLAPSATIRIDLRPELDGLLVGMKKSHRRYIRRAPRRGITCRRGGEGDLVSFHRLLSITAQRHGFAPPELNHILTMWRVLNREGCAELFIAEHSGEPVSAQLVVAFGDTVVAKRKEWSGQYSSAGPNYVMDWETIRWAKAQHYGWYDMGESIASLPISCSKTSRLRAT